MAGILAAGKRRSGRARACCGRQWAHLGNVAQFARDWEKGGGIKCKYRRVTTVFGILGNVYLNVRIVLQQILSGYPGACVSNNVVERMLSTDLTFKMHALTSE